MSESNERQDTLNCSEIPNNSDTISRQAALDVLDEYQVMVENGEENPYAWARGRMCELPSAQPAPCDDAIDSLLRSMETVLESDKRTLKSPVSEEGWLYDAIHKWRKELSRIFR